MAFVAIVAIPTSSAATGVPALDGVAQRARGRRGDVDARGGDAEELDPGALAPRPRRRHAQAARDHARARDERVALAPCDLDGRAEPRDDARFARRDDRVDADDFAGKDDDRLARAHVGRRQLDRVVALDGAHAHVERAFDRLARDLHALAGARDGRLDRDGHRAAEPREHRDRHGVRIGYPLRPPRRSHGAARRARGRPADAGRTDRGATAARGARASPTRRRREARALRPPQLPSRPMAGASTPATIPRPSRVAVRPSERRSGSDGDVGLGARPAAAAGRPDGSVAGPSRDADRTDEDGPDAGTSASGGSDLGRGDATIPESRWTDGSVDRGAEGGTVDMEAGPFDRSAVEAAIATPPLFGDSA